MAHGAVFLFWIASACVEGIKFGQHDKVLGLDYHVWRLVQSAAVILLVIAMPVVWPDALALWVIGWWLYERLLSWLWFGSPLAQRGYYWIMGIDIRHNNIVEALIALAGVVWLVL